jgi:hypothetical protein
MEQHWSMGVYSVFWAERVNPCKCMGFSLYFAVTGAYPILQFDISEATCLQSLLTLLMSSTNLIAHHTVTLQKCTADVNTLYSKVYSAQLKAACQFKQQHLHTLSDFNVW